MRGFPKNVSATTDAHNPSVGAELWNTSEQLTGVRYLIMAPVCQHRDKGSREMTAGQ